MDQDARDRILDATMHLATVHGLSRLSLSDVAKHVGLSRPTVYRHFPGRDELIAAMVGREADRLAAEVIASIRGLETPHEVVRVALLETLRLAREHPLLDRILRTEPETLVPALMAGWRPGSITVLGRVRDAADAFLANAMPELDVLARRRVSDILARLLVSYAINPPDDPPEVVAASVAVILTGANETEWRPS
jgi:AcrR family transcriptional regulator